MKLKRKNSQGMWESVAPSQKEFDTFKTESTLQLADKAEKSDLQAVSLAFKESYPTLAALQTAYPTGNIYNHAVLSDGMIYTYKNGWISTGLKANGTGIADESIVAGMTTFFKTSLSSNIFNKTKITNDQALNEANGTGIALVGYLISDYIKINTTKIYYTTKSWSCSWYDGNKVFISSVTGAGTLKTLTPPANAVYLRATFKYTDINTSMVSPDALPSTYVAYSETLGFKNTKQKEDIANEILSVIQTAPPSEWIGKVLKGFGTSISWQDGKAYTSGVQSGQIARGYQTIMREQLGVSIQNLANSGARMANTTAGGADQTISINKIIRETSFVGVDAVLIEAGTNDQKYDIPLGVIGDIRTTSFDVTTFCGAYRDSIEYILSQNPNTIIFLITPPQNSLSGWGYSPNAEGKILKDFAAVVKEIGNLYGLTVFDVFGESGINKFTLPSVTRDLVHPIDSGYEMIAKPIIPHFKAV